MTLQCFEGPAPTPSFDDQTGVLIRPIRPDDEPLIVRFHATLSERSVYFRYFHMMALSCRTAHQRLAKICSVDPAHEIVLVGERKSPEFGDTEIVGVGRLVKAVDKNEAEFAVLISDAFHHHGLGTELVRRLVAIARELKLARVTAEILPENDQMLGICRALGFQTQYCPGEHLVKAELLLKS